MIGFDEAVECVRLAAIPLSIETVPIAEASSRVLARPVKAEIDSPRSAVSAMDGYAVREEDLRNLPAILQVVGDSFAGAASQAAVERGTCVRIFTGAPLPQGADRVVIQENVQREGARATVEGNLGPARHIRRRGSDFQAGDELLAAGTFLGPRAMVAAAAADVAEVQVYRRPTVHILSTGDELAQPGMAGARADAIPESVSFGVAALAEQWGARHSGSTRLKDDLPSMEAAARAAIGCVDVIVVTGGASVGEKDFAKAMFEPLGLELIFSKVSIKPGKPVWMGRAGNRLVMGLPGNPSSAMVTARLFLAALLSGLSGRGTDAALRWQRVPLASPVKAGGDREAFHRARWSNGAAEILSFQDSSAQKTLAQADLLVRQRAFSPAAEPGGEVEVLDF